MTYVSVQSVADETALAIENWADLQADCDTDTQYDQATATARFGALIHGHRFEFTVRLLNKDDGHAGARATGA